MHLLDKLILVLLTDKTLTRGEKLAAFELINSLEEPPIEDPLEVTVGEELPH